MACEVAAATAAAELTRLRGCVWWCFLRGGIALVGEPSGRYLWILSRTPTISDETRDAAVNDLRRMGYYTDELYWTEQATSR